MPERYYISRRVAIAIVVAAILLAILLLSCYNYAEKPCISAKLSVSLMSSNFKDMSKLIKPAIGTKFNKLTVIGYCITSDRLVKFKCDCGNKRTLYLSKVKKGENKSCGCLSINYKDIGKNAVDYRSLYSRWRAMRNRCYMKNAKNYHNYGGRGITVCEEWRGCFRGFYEWGIKTGFNKSLQLDRMDNNAGYSPDNCRWTTSKENCLNTRRVVYLKIGLVTKKVREWSELSGFSYDTLMYRVRTGWAENDFFSPLRKNQYG